MYRAGPSDFEGLYEQVREAALHNNVFSDLAGQRVIMAIRLGSQPIGSLGLQGPLQAGASSAEGLRRP